MISSVGTTRIFHSELSDKPDAVIHVYLVLDGIDKMGWLLQVEVRNFGVVTFLAGVPYVSDLLVL